MYKANLTTAAVTGCSNRLLCDKAAVLRDGVKGTLCIQDVIWVNTRVNTGNSSILLLSYIPPLLKQT